MGSRELVAWLGESPNEPRSSSELAVVEVIRACRRCNPLQLPDARSLLLRIDLVPLSTDILYAAADLGPPGLRSLDAIHLASALTLGDALTAFVAYDRRLLAAAEAEGLPAFAPS